MTQPHLGAILDSGGDLYRKRLALAAALHVQLTFAPGDGDLKRDAGLHLQIASATRLTAALPLLGDPDVCVTLNTDAIWAGPNPLGQLLAEWDPKRMDALLACVPLSATVGRTKGGDFTVREDGRIGWGGDMVYGGAQLIRTGLFAGDPRSVFSMADVWNAMVANRRLFGAVYPGRWCDVGHPEGIALAEGLLAGSHV